MPEKSDEQLAAEAARLEARLDTLKPRLLAYPNVLEVYVGIKTVAGLGTDTVCLIAEVSDKKPDSELAPGERIPQEIDGVPVDVFEREEAVLESEVYCGGYPLGGGTLGVFGVATAANAHLSANDPVMVTNQHVYSRVGAAVGVGSVCDCYCSHCCEDGVVVDAQRNATVDVAIARLSSETRYSHEILEIGPVRGSTAPTVGMQIYKYGKTTKLTHGRIQSFPPSISVSGLTMNNQIRVVPVAPSTDFSEGGDSGSVYVQKSTNQVVGLHHSGPQGGPTANGSQIPAVLTAMNISIPVVGTADSIPLAALASVRSVSALRASVAALEAKLRSSALGQRWLDLLARHVDEVRDLVNHDRRAKVVWQRVQGPAFVSHWVKSAREPDYRVPAEIGGMRVENALLAMAAALRERGSPALARDATEHYLTVLELARGCRRAGDFAERVDAYVGSDFQPHEHQLQPEDHHG